MLKQRGWRLARQLLIILLLPSISACAWLGEQQRRVIYRPTPATRSTVDDLPAGAQLYGLPVPGQDALALVTLWWLPSADAAAPTLLYLHGTFRNLQGNRHKIESLHQAGFNVLALDYRGWGQSSPITPSEQTILQDARVGWAELVRREPRASQRLIYGHSMGSGVAVDLASQLHWRSDYGGLILESAFTRFADVARAAGFWAGLAAWFSNERFDSLAKIPRVDAPVLMLHGTHDDTVPIALGEMLFAAATTPKRWVSIAGGGHSDSNQVAPQRYRQALQSFNEQLVAPASAASAAQPGKPQ